MNNEVAVWLARLSWKDWMKLNSIYWMKIEWCGGKLREWLEKENIKTKTNEQTEQANQIRHET